MYWTSPRTPCSGPNSAASVTPGAAQRKSARWRKRPSTLVGLTMAPTFNPRSARNCSASQTSSPVLTRITVPERTPTDAVLNDEMRSATAWSASAARAIS